MASTDFIDCPPCLPGCVECALGLRGRWINEDDDASLSTTTTTTTSLSTNPSTNPSPKPASATQPLTEPEQEHLILLIDNESREKTAEKEQNEKSLQSAYEVMQRFIEQMDRQQKLKQEIAVLIEIVRQEREDVGNALEEEIQALEAVREEEEQEIFWE